MCPNDTAGVFHGVDALYDTESNRHIAEMVVPIGSDGVQQRADRVREILIDVGIGPGDAAARFVDGRWAGF